jgi:multimeric flavodoxin WrbA
VCSSYCIKHPYRCSIDDELSALLERMICADILNLGTPLYFRAAPAQFQAFTDCL